MSENTGRVLRAVEFYLIVDTGMDALARAPVERWIRESTQTREVLVTGARTAGLGRGLSAGFA